MQKENKKELLQNQKKVLINYLQFDSLTKFNL